MGSPKIVFDNPSGIYVPGSHVSGFLQFSLRKQRSFDAVILEVYGEAKTSFMQTQQRTVDRLVNNGGTYRAEQQTLEIDVPCEARIIYLDEALVLWSSADGLDRLNEGIHRLPFAFDLPQECASSFEGAYGSVRYHCKAKFDVSWFFDKGTEAQITVSRPVDLHAEPNTNLPAQSEISHEVMRSCSCCCSADVGTIRLKTFLPKRGYDPGELIEVTMEIMNNSSKTLRRLVLTIIQITSYIGFNESIEVEQCIIDEQTVTTTEAVISVAPKQLDVIRRRITVPKVPPSCSDCRLIHLKYALRVKVGARSSEKYSVGTNIPITIGSNSSVSAGFLNSLTMCLK